MELYLKKKTLVVLNLIRCFFIFNKNSMYCYHFCYLYRRRKIFTKNLYMTFFFFLSKIYFFIWMHTLRGEKNISNTKAFTEKNYLQGRHH